MSGVGGGCQLSAPLNLHFSLHGLIRRFLQRAFQFHARREDDAGLDGLRLELLFRCRTLARERGAERAELAQLNAETVAQVGRQALYEVQQHVVDVAPRQRRPAGDVARDVAQRLPSRVHGVGIKLLFRFLLRVWPLHQFDFHVFNVLMLLIIDYSALGAVFFSRRFRLPFFRLTEALKFLPVCP